ncbi:MAG: hypothetical protein ACJAZN_002241 [Planctomycetota bacterium]|jgi:hypothetical protein
MERKLQVERSRRTSLSATDFPSILGAPLVKSLTTFALFAGLALASAPASFGQA